MDPPPAFGRARDRHRTEATACSSFWPAQRPHPCRYRHRLASRRRGPMAPCRNTHPAFAGCDHDWRRRGRRVRHQRTGDVSKRRGDDLSHDVVCAGGFLVRRGRWFVRYFPDGPRTQSDRARWSTPMAGWRMVEGEPSPRAARRSGISQADRLFTPIFRPSPARSHSTKTRGQTERSPNFRRGVKKKNQVNVPSVPGFLAARYDDPLITGGSWNA